MGELLEDASTSAIGKSGCAKWGWNGTDVKCGKHSKATPTLSFIYTYYVNVLVRHII